MTQPTAQPGGAGAPPAASARKPLFADTTLGRIIVGCVIAIVSAGLTLLVSKLVSHSSSPPPKVHITSVGWVTSANHAVGQYMVTGYVDHLAAGQVIWSFNQPDDPHNAGRIYADPGPCDLSGQTFTCDLGTATLASQWNITVAVVTEGQGYSFARQKAGFDPDLSKKPLGFSSLDAVPHISGSDDSMMLYR
jgi:hypothetical protein